MPLFSGCSHLPVSRSTFQKQQTEISNLKTEKSNIEQKYNEEINKKKNIISDSEKQRISIGGAQSIAVLGTLKAEPQKTKYTEAGIKGLEVTQNALQDQVSTKDLLEAINTQSNLLSEQANQIAEGNKQINELNNQIDGYKNNENKLKIDIAKAEIEKVKILEEKAQIIEKKENDLKEKQDKINDLNAEKAEKFDKENKWYVRLNPFTHLSKFFSSIFFWIIFFIIFGVILKVCSIIFPGVNVIQVIVKGIGSFVGGILKMIFGVIPNLFHGLGAVDQKEHEKVKIIAQNSTGAIQNFRDDHPEEYKKLKEKLVDWNKDHPELDSEITKMLNDLNQL